MEDGRKEGRQTQGQRGREGDRREVGWGRDQCRAGCRQGRSQAMARGVDSIERPWKRQSRKAREENLPPMSSEQQGALQLPWPLTVPYRFLPIVWAAHEAQACHLRADSRRGKPEACGPERKATSETTLRPDMLTHLTGRRHIGLQAWSPGQAP